MMRDVLLYFSLIHQGDWKKIYTSIAQKESIDKALLAKFKQQLKYSYITILDGDYPSSLKQVVYPPYLLYYSGDISLLSQSKKIAVIGSREASDYGLVMTKSLTTEMVQEGYIVVSGGAKGIDICAQRTCLEIGGKTIAIVGHGLNHYYPYENRAILQQIHKHGLVLSEYPPHTLPQKHHFPARNRLIAGLVDAVVVVEAKVKSGSLITVKHALDIGKDIYCVPYRANENSACNELIKQGAILMETWLDYQG